MRFVIPVIELCRKAHACDPGNIFRAGTHVVLLSPSEDHGAQLHPLIHIEEAHALGAVELVSADGEHVDVSLFGPDPELAVGLDGIRVEIAGRILLLYDPAQLFDGLYGSDLVIDIHDAYQDRVRPDGGSQGFRIHTAVSVHGKEGHLIALSLQKLQGLIDGGMLDAEAYDVLSPLSPAKGRADEGQIVRLRSPGGKEDLPRLYLQGVCDLRPGGLHIILRPKPHHMFGGGISVILLHDLIHQPYHLRGYPGGGCIIKINFHTSFLYSASNPISAAISRRIMIMERTAMAAVSVRRILFPRETVRTP